MENIHERTLQVREKFNEHFPKPHSLVVALHSKNLEHALEGAKIAYENGADGVALVTHALKPDQWIQIVDAIKNKYPHGQAIINILQWSDDPREVFESLKGINADGVWTDRANIYGVDTLDENLEGYSASVDELRAATK